MTRDYVRSHTGIARYLVKNAFLALDMIDKHKDPVANLKNVQRLYITAVEKYSSNIIEQLLKSVIVNLLQLELA